MHEAAIAAPLLKLVLETARNHAKDSGCQLRVTGVRIRVGLLQCLELSTLNGIFALMAEGTEAEGCAVSLEIEPMRGSCPDCGKDIAIEKRSFECPHCGCARVTWKGGNELYVAAITVLPG